MFKLKVYCSFLTHISPHDDINIIFWTEIHYKKERGDVAAFVFGFVQKKLRDHLHSYTVLFDHHE